jgi:hypothetical protein
MRRTAKAVAIAIAAVAVVAVLISLLLLRQKENNRLGCAYRGGTMVRDECVTTTARH